MAKAQYLGRQKPIRTALQAVREIFEIADQSELSASAAAEKAGLYRNAPSLWRRGEHGPAVDGLDAFGRQYGYRLTWVRIDDATEE